MQNNTNMSLRSVKRSKSSKGCFPLRRLFRGKKKKKRTSDEHDLEGTSVECTYEELPPVDPNDQLAMCIFNPKPSENIPQESVVHWTREGQICSSTDNWTSSNLALIPVDKGSSKDVSTNPEYLTTAIFESKRTPVKNQNKTQKEDSEVSYRTTGAGLPICNPVNSATHENESHYLDLRRTSVLCPSGVNLEGQRDVLQLGPCGNRSENTYETIDGYKTPKPLDSLKLQGKNVEYSKTLLRETEKHDENSTLKCQYNYAHKTEAKTPRPCSNSRNNVAFLKQNNNASSKFAREAGDSNSGQVDCSRNRENDSSLSKYCTAGILKQNDNVNSEFAEETGYLNSGKIDCSRNLGNDSSCSNNCTVLEDKLKSPSAGMNRKECVPLSDNTSMSTQSDSPAPGFINDHSETGAESTPLPDFGTLLHESACSGSDVMDDAMNLPTVSMQTLTIEPPSNASNSVVSSSVKYSTHSVAANTCRPLRTSSYSSDESLLEKCSNTPNLPDSGETDLTQLNSNMNDTNSMISDSETQNDTIQSDEIELTCDYVDPDVGYKRPMTAAISRPPQIVQRWLDDFCISRKFAVIRPGVSGGTYNLSQLGLSVSVPENALPDDSADQDLLFVHSRNKYDIPKNTKPVSDVYHFLPHSLKLKERIMLNFPLNDRSCTGGFRLMYSDTDHNSTPVWRKLEDSTRGQVGVDGDDDTPFGFLADGKYHLFLKHFCLFTVVWDDNGVSYEAYKVHMSMYGTYNPVSDVLQFTVPIQMDQSTPPLPKTDMGILLDEDSFLLKKGVPLDCELEIHDGMTIENQKVPSKNTLLKLDELGSGPVIKIGVSLGKTLYPEDAVPCSITVRQDSEKIHLFDHSKVLKQLIMSSLPTSPVSVPQSKPDTSQDASNDYPSMLAMSSHNQRPRTGPLEKKIFKFSNNEIQRGTRLPVEGGENETSTIGAGRPSDHTLLRNIPIDSIIPHIRERHWVPEPVMPAGLLQQLCEQLNNSQYGQPGWKDLLRALGREELCEVVERHQNPTEVVVMWWQSGRNLWSEFIDRLRQINRVYMAVEIERWRAALETRTQGAGRDPEETLVKLTLHQN